MKVCDKCRKPFVSKNEIYELDLVGNQYDLCKVCADEVERFVKAPAKKGKFFGLME